VGTKSKVLSARALNKTINLRISISPNINVKIRMSVTLSKIDEENKIKTKNSLANCEAR